MKMKMKMTIGAARVAGQGTPGGVRLPAGRGGKAVCPVGLTTGAARVAGQGTPGWGAPAGRTRRQRRMARGVDNRRGTCRWTGHPRMAATMSFFLLFEAASPAARRDIPHPCAGPPPPRSTSVWSTPRGACDPAIARLQWPRQRGMHPLRLSGPCWRAAPLLIQDGA